MGIDDPFKTNIKKGAGSVLSEKDSVIQGFSRGIWQENGMTCDKKINQILPVFRVKSLVLQRRASSGFQSVSFFGS